MNLNEIKKIGTAGSLINEGVIPWHISLTLDQVIRDGKVTNPVQFFVMGALVEMFQHGDVTRWPRDLNAYSMSTNAFLIDSLKQLSEVEQASLALWLAEKLQAPAHFESNPYACNPNMDTLEWVRWVIKRQA
jgi:hypothetical protein